MERGVGVGMSCIGSRDVGSTRASTNDCLQYEHDMIIAPTNSYVRSCLGTGRRPAQCSLLRVVSTCVRVSRYSHVGRNLERKKTARFVKWLEDPSWWSCGVDQASAQDPSALLGMLGVPLGICKPVLGEQLLIQQNDSVALCQVELTVDKNNITSGLFVKLERCVTIRERGKDMLRDHR